jgi:uncharacterized protein (DUF2141 family)
MKYLLLVVLISNTIIFAQDSTVTGTIIVDMIGFKSDEGSVKVALCNTNEDFDDQKNAFRGVSAGITRGMSQTIFEELVYGEYAVKVYHDENSNDKMDTNFLGIPKECYGFSNDARERFGPASWEDAKFILNSDTLNITITIQ